MLAKVDEARLIQVSGGDKRNAIARECHATLIVSNNLSMSPRPLPVFVYSGKWKGPHHLQEHAYNDFLLTVTVPPAKVARAISSST